MAGRKIQRALAATYEVDIAAEFKAVKDSIAEGNARLSERLDEFKTEIAGWKSVFDTQLSKLNSNMDKALSTIADHEARLTKIEEEALRRTVRTQTVSEMSKLMFFVAKGLIGAGIVAGAVLGTAGAWKALFPGA